MRNVFIAILSLMIFTQLSCSAMMVVRGPAYKNLDLLQEGTPRTFLINEFGAPMHTERNPDGTKEVTWRFKQGDKKWVKVVKVPIYIAGDFFTLFASEILTMPFEMIMEQNMTTYIVVFDENDKVISHQIIGATG